MNEKGLVASLKIRAVHDDPAVETPRAEKGFIQNLRTVRCRQNDDALGRVEAVDFGKELIECLLPLVVAAEFGIAAAADGVDLIDENDGGSDLGSFLEQVADTARADADEHLNKVRTGNGEERHMRLTGNRFRKQRLAGTGRANEQRALRQLRADGGIFFGVVQEVDDLLERFLRLVLTGHVLEGHAGFLLHIYLGLAFSDVADAAQAAVAAGSGHQQPTQQAQPEKQQQREKKPGKDHRTLLNDLTAEFHAALPELTDDGRQIYVRQDAGIVHSFQAGILVLFENIIDSVRFDLHLRDLVVLQSGEKGVVCGFLLLRRTDHIDKLVAQDRHDDHRDNKPDDRQARFAAVVVVRTSLRVLVCHESASFRHMTVV